MDKLIQFVKKHLKTFLIMFLIIVCLYLVRHRYEILSFIDSKGFYAQEEVILNANLKLSQCFYNKKRLLEKSFALKSLLEFYNSQKEYEKSIVLYESYIQKDEWRKLARYVTFPPNIDKAGVYSDLAELYYLNGQYEKAVSFYNKAIELKSLTPYSELLSNDIYDIAEEYNGLVVTYLAMHDIACAKANLDKSLNIVNLLPKNSLQTRFFTNLTASTFYLETQNYPKAEYYATQLFLTIPSQTLPVESYIRYQSYYNIIANSQMGKIKFRENNYNEAETFQRKALFMTEEFYGVNSASTLCSYNTLLQTLDKLDQNVRYTDYIEQRLLKIGKKLVKFQGKDITLDDITKFCEK